MTNKKERPDYWSKWTRYLALPILLVVIVLFLPVYLFVGAYSGMRETYDTWKDELIDVWRSYHDEQRICTNPNKGAK